MNAKHLRYTVLVLSVIFPVLAFFQSNIHGDIRAVVLNGQPAPGFPGGRFLGFSGASVNASGDMAFGASVNVGGVESAGIFAVLAGVLTPIALQGQLLPDGSGRNFGGGFFPPQINDNGAIVFSANFTGTTNYRGIFEYSGGTLWNVVDQSTPVPGMPGATFVFFPTSVLINNSGEIAFSSEFISPNVSGPTPTGIFTVSQGIVQTVFTTAGYTLPFALNNNGDIASGIANNGISVYSGGTITQVVKAGQTVPIPVLLYHRCRFRQSTMRKTSSFLRTALPAVTGEVA